MTDDEVISQVRDILDGWQDVRVERVSSLWVIGARYNGQAHAGARDNAITLAGDLAALAHRAPEPQPEPEIELADDDGPAFPPSPVELEAAGGSAPPVASEPTPEPEPEPQPVSIDAMLAAGTMLVEDEIALRENMVRRAIDDYAGMLIEALTETNNANDRITLAMSGHHKSANGQNTEITDEENDAMAWWNAVTARKQAIRDAADRFKQNVIGLPLNVLKGFTVSEAPWP